MAKTNEFKGGPVIRAANTYEGEFRASEDSALITVDGHARFYEQGSRKLIYTVTTAITGLALNSTMNAPQGTGNCFLAILNPLGSGVNLEILRGWIGITLGTITLPVGPWCWCGAYQAGIVTSAGATAVARSTFVSQNLPRARYYSAAALTTGRAFFNVRPFSACTFAAALAATTADKIFVDNVDGALVVPPGCAIALSPATAGSTAAAAGGIQYAEVPLPEGPAGQVA